MRNRVLFFASAFAVLLPVMSTAVADTMVKKCSKCEESCAKDGKEICTKPVCTPYTETACH